MENNTFILKTFLTNENVFELSYFDKIDNYHYFINIDDDNLNEKIDSNITNLTTRSLYQFCNNYIQNKFNYFLEIIRNDNNDISLYFTYNFEICELYICIKSLPLKEVVNEKRLNEMEKKINQIEIQIKNLEEKVNEVSSSKKVVHKNVVQSSDKNKIKENIKIVKSKKEECDENEIFLNNVLNGSMSVSSDEDSNVFALLTKTQKERGLMKKDEFRNKFSKAIEISPYKKNKHIEDYLNDKNEYIQCVIIKEYVDILVTNNGLVMIFHNYYNMCPEKALQNVYDFNVKMKNNYNKNIKELFENNIDIHRNALKEGNMGIINYFTKVDKFIDLIKENIDVIKK